jgi:hypothetical protein
MKDKKEQKLYLSRIYSSSFVDIRGKKKEVAIFEVIRVNQCLSVAKSKCFKRKGIWTLKRKSTTPGF